jgi:hypothetical protein
MVISNELMLAILAMDAYHQGYAAGIEGVGTQIGTATQNQQSNVNPQSEEVKARFYAVAYDWNGEKVISYRGTDNPSLGTGPVSGGSDVWNGYPIGAGQLASQAPLAEQFYDADTKQRRYPVDAFNLLLEAKFHDVASSVRAAL